MDNSFIKGIISGYVGAICVYPIDVIKTRMQNNINLYYKNGFDCLHKIIKNEGYKTFYKGSFIQLIGIGPEKAIKLTVNDFVLSNFTNNNLIAGACAGASQVMITNPIEVIKIQYQMKTNGTLSLYQTIKYIGGIKQLYKGATVCFLRDIPFSAIYFSAYDYLKKNLVINNTNYLLSGSNYLLSGLLSAIPAAYLVTPMDVIKTRIQTKNNNYVNIIDCVKQIYYNEGFKAFWRGGVWRVLKSSPQFGITLYLYEQLSTIK